MPTGMSPKSCLRNRRASSLQFPTRLRLISNVDRRLASELLSLVLNFHSRQSFPSFLTDCRRPGSWLLPATGEAVPRLQNLANGLRLRPLPNSILLSIFPLLTARQGRALTLQEVRHYGDLQQGQHLASNATLNCGKIRALALSAMVKTPFTAK